MTVGVGIALPTRKLKRPISLSISFVWFVPGRLGVPAPESGAPPTTKLSKEVLE
jgi:hypothetical protein